MTKRLILVAVFVISCAAIACAQLPMLNFGSGTGGQGGTPLAACGSGTINLSTGCPQPMLGGL